MTNDFDRYAAQLANGTFPRATTERTAMYAARWGEVGGIHVGPSTPPKAPDPIADALARIEAKLDALTYFSGWVDGSGRPLTVAEMAEKARHQDREAPTDSRGLPRVEER